MRSVEYALDGVNADTGMKQASHQDGGVNKGKGARVVALVGSFHRSVMRTGSFFAFVERVARCRGAKQSVRMHPFIRTVTLPEVRRDYKAQIALDDMTGIQYLNWIAAWWRAACVDGIAFAGDDGYDGDRNSVKLK